MELRQWILAFEVLLGLALQVMSDASPAKIIVPPKDMKVIENGVAIFYCFTTGNPTPEVTWLKNGKVIAAGKRRYNILNLKGGSLLRMSRISAKKDTILITCDVGNGVGQGESASATVHIYKTETEPDGFPFITTQPNFRVVETGRPVVMTCSAAGDPAPTVRWLKEWQPVDMEEPRFSLSPSGSLRIERAKSSDSGKYECVAENSVGTDYSYSANLHVRGESISVDTDIVRKVYPYISSSPPAEMTVEYGDTLNLTCIAFGNPEPKVFWVSEFKTVSANDNVPFGKNSLIIVSMRKTGNYTCVAISELGTTQYTTHIKVKDAGVRPVFTIIPQDQVVDEGGSLVLDCEAKGRPQPNVVWIKNNDQITTKGDSSNGRSTLSLTNITEAANYTCVAGSPLGMVSVTAAVIIRQQGPAEIIKDDIDSIKGLRKKSTTSSSVTLSWWPPIRPGVSSYMVTWVEGKDPNISDITTNFTLGTITFPPVPDQTNASVVTVPDLLAATTYTFSVTAMFNDGSTSSSSVVSTTRIEAPALSGVPQVLSTEQRTICTIHLDLAQFIVQMQPEYTYHLLVVVPLERPSLDPDEIQLENMTMAGTPDSAYITAEFGDKIPDKFILGDGKVYGNYVNRQLLPDKKYRIFLRVYTIDPKTSETVHTSTPYSDVLHGDKCIRNGILKTSTQPRQYSGGHCGRCGATALVPSGILLALILLRAFSKPW
ncbi:tyrosine-protein phosphatase Lar-like isoform X2 [Lineus longissimus]|uniref:tyrosine-protein phosphatase Lar-like isoform X2 n=1 Tax=Lineus longissimus TaxID=88925 RepID=UPI002B4CB261